MDQVRFRIVGDSIMQDVLVTGREGKVTVASTGVCVTNGTRVLALPTGTTLRQKKGYRLATLSELKERFVAGEVRGGEQEDVAGKAFDALVVK